MATVVALGFAIVLLLITLDIALSYLAGPVSLLKRTGAQKAGRWAARSVWRGTQQLFRFLIRGRRPRIRRAPSRASARHLR
jgi:hypothetical protein